MPSQAFSKDPPGSAWRRTASPRNAPRAHSRWPMVVTWVVGLAVAGLFIFTVAQLFAGRWQVNPVLLHWGPFTLRWYGLLIATGLLVGYSLAEATAPLYGISRDHIFNLLLILTPVGLIGARLGFVIQNVPYYWQHPREIIATWEGGLSIHGVLAAGLLGVLIYARMKRVSLASLLDISLPALLVGQAIGRWGNFLNQEVFGYPTNVPWKMYVPPQSRPLEYLNQSFFHPVFLYESIWNFGSAIFMLWYLRQPQAHRGDGLPMYLVLYSLGRFWVEFFRIGVPYWANLTLAQWASLLLMAAGGVALWWRHRQWA